ncbi:MAG: hypothetical protein K1V95_01510 [Eubacterium sp.]
MRGVFKELAEQGCPDEVIEAIKDSVDCNLYFFDNQVPTETMYLILGSAVAVLIFIYIMMHAVKSRKAKLHR